MSSSFGKELISIMLIKFEKINEKSTKTYQKIVKRATFSFF